MESNLQAPRDGNKKRADDVLRVDAVGAEGRLEVALKDGVSAEEEGDNGREEVERGWHVFAEAEDIRARVLAFGFGHGRRDARSRRRFHAARAR